MKKVIRPAGFFATLTAPKSWAERIAAIKAKASKAGKQKPTAKLEIDDANGEKLDFPEIGDVSEIAEGVAVVATDGDHVFEADGKIYTLTVASGVVTAVVVTDAQDPAEEMSAETAEFVEAVATGLAEAEAFKVEANAKIANLETKLAELATLKADFATLKATLKHSDDGMKSDDLEKPKAVKVGGKSIDLSKINLK